MRDLTKVAGFINDVVIPKEETVLRELIKHIIRKVFYIAPEIQGVYWADFACILEYRLGDPKGCKWKERVVRIMANREKIPDSYLNPLTGDYKTIVAPFMEGKIRNGGVNNLKEESRRPPKPGFK